MGRGTNRFVFNVAHAMPVSGAGGVRTRLAKAAGRSSSSGSLFPMVDILGRCSFHGTFMGAAIF
jgi:hypothetical protein